MLDQNNEIQEALSRTYETPEGFDDDALEAELNALEEYISEEDGPVRSFFFFLFSFFIFFHFLSFQPAWLEDMPSTTAPVAQPAQPAAPIQL